jgi:pilus assembly protein CpaC
MKYDRFMKAAVASLSLAIASIPITSSAETLRVVRGSASAPLAVPMNRAIVVESDEPFAEISIANPGIADISSLSDRTIYLLGKEPGRTTMTILGPEGRLISNVEVQVTPDIAEFKERLEQILPGEPIEVRTANNGIVLSGTISSTARLDRALELAQRYAPERVSNLMSVGGTQQVMLKVRFAEMQRNVSKSLASSMAARGTALNGNLGTTGGTGSLINSGAVSNTFSGSTPASNANNGAFLFGFNAGGLEAGGEYPVPISQEGGQISVEYKPFGVELSFVPRVVDGDIINLELMAAVSSIDPSSGFTANGFTVNAFKRRETSTTVEMRDGESFAIAGLLSDDFTDLNGQVPWLGDVPVLGALFRSVEYSRNQTELVIVVTPHLVTPTRGLALALPTDRVQPPTEKDLFLFGRVAASNAPKSGGAAEVARQDFSGSYGYVME